MAKKLGDFKPAANLKVGVVLKSLSNQYWQGIESGIKAAAKKYNVDVTVQAANSESSRPSSLRSLRPCSARASTRSSLSPEAASNLIPALEADTEGKLPIVNTDDARIAATVYVGPSP